mmetsp:Transcript_17338/g.50384  ORF Transcript_17338/g.50384 Transcript_17338/m.50384 type:complete len:254 (-) Transcript_17338:911-1672(-)
MHTRVPPLRSSERTRPVLGRRDASKQAKPTNPSGGMKVELSEEATATASPTVLSPPSMSRRCNLSRARARAPSTDLRIESSAPSRSTPFFRRRACGRPPGKSAPAKSPSSVTSRAPIATVRIPFEPNSRTAPSYQSAKSTPSSSSSSSPPSTPPPSCPRRRSIRSGDPLTTRQSLVRPSCISTRTRADDVRRAGSKGNDRICHNRAGRSLPKPQKPPPPPAEAPPFPPDARFARGGGTVADAPCVSPSYFHRE